MDATHPTMGTSLVTARMPQLALETARTRAGEIGKHVRMQSPVLTAAIMAYGLPVELAELCGGVLASVVEDLIAIGRLPKSDYDRTRRKQRVLAAANEPALSAMRIACAASPINGHAAVAHWDVVCEKWELGKLAWLMGLETETAYKYGKRILKMHEKGA